MRVHATIAALVSLAASPAQAHRGHDALSTVTIDAKGGVTVVHRFEAHDIEPALSTIAPDAQASLDDPDAVAALVRYLSRRFSIADKQGTVTLTPSSRDIGAAQVTFSFTGKLRGSPKSISISSRILSDVYAKQVNQVNIRHRGQ